MRRIRQRWRGCLLIVLAMVVLGIVAQLFPDNNESGSDSAQLTSQPAATNIPPTATNIPPTATNIPPTATSIPPTATSIPPTATSIPPTSLGFPLTRFSSSLTRYTHGQVNLRKGPGTSYELAGSVSAGSPIEVVGESGDWYLINRNGSELYIAGWLTFDSPLSQPGGGTTNVGAQSPATAVQAPANVGSCPSGPNNVPGQTYEETCGELKEQGICGFPKGDQNYSLRRDRDKDGCACDCN